MRPPNLVVCLLAFACWQCSGEKERVLFAIRGAADTGIAFQNTIVTNDTTNAVTFEYIYNGSGVGVGDFNRDGLQDLFFGGNDVSAALYLNEGRLRFRDVTEASGTTTDKWITGVSVVDINVDGWPDIYLSVAGKTSPERRKNLLFVNQGLKDGVPYFEEQASAFGLDDDSYSTMAAFFDYDQDGDLDVYLVNNWLEKFNRNNLRPKRVNGEAESTDRLYRNNGDLTFSDVSADAGILIEGYGLGVAICDINDDAWPDIYVSNDFLSNDLLWINQRDGTFRNEIGKYLKHQTHNAMGVDVADFNNDALQDIVVVDMLPPDHKRQKLMTPGQNYDIFHMAIDQGYEPQYMRNTLQLNRGKLPDGRMLFSEIAFMAGMAQTDWSWAPLFADFDNDGWKDLFIANGYRKDVTHLDFIFFGMTNSPFGTPEKRKETFSKELNQLEEVKVTNHIFRNTGSLVFEDKTEAWGVKMPSFTNGAAYADLDNDGDLDLITNNIDQEVLLYENRLRDQKGAHHYLRLAPEASFPVGEKIFCYADGKTQFIEMTPYRGFQSTVEHAAHFGLGSATTVDSVIIRWPNGSETLLRDISADTTITYSSGNARKPFQSDHHQQAMTYFSKERPVAVRHRETSPPDILMTRTLLHELTRYGPCIAVADVNGDRLDDFYMGGEKGEGGRLFVQDRSGHFQQGVFPADSSAEDGGAVFFDADGDGDPDLYVASCAASSQEHATAHRLYINEGNGSFALAGDALPAITASASCVEPADYDGDGDIDLFVGGRIKTAEYPYSPRSYILRNDDGKFTDVTHTLSELLVEPGMISSACWADVNNDGRPDLLTAGEWQPIRVFINQGERFQEETRAFGLDQLNGWWNCLVVADLNNDGYADILAGNTGKNSFFKPTKEQPVQLMAADFDRNGSVDPIVSYFNPVEQDRFIVHNRLVLIDQIPAVKRRFENFTKYATTPLSEAFQPSETKDALLLEANKLESIALINNSGKSFSVTDLPELAQVSAINDFLAEDLNDDGFKDLVIVGNTYSQETLFGRYDASIGLVLLNNGKGGWDAVNNLTSGFMADNDARNIHLLNTVSGRLVMVANNNDSLQFFRLQPQRGVNFVRQ